jgi:16S rRNA (cytidine1402-2'-O)-methyltransferase
MGTLYVVATPIGNLGDMTPRAVETLRSVSLIAAEDTRHSGTLLKAFDIQTPMLSYHHHNRRQREQRLLEALEAGDVALISDAGTPGIADPGRELAESARRAGHTVMPIPGASSLAAAVSASGLVTGPFVFLGFLDRSGEERRLQLGKAAATGWPMVLFESPVRLGQTLADLRDALGDREAVIARELTKLHEEVSGGSLVQLTDAYANREVKGEIVIIVGQDKATSTDAGDVRGLIRRLLADGLKPSRAAREVAAIAGLPSDEAYALVREVAKERG